MWMYESSLLVLVASLQWDSGSCIDLGAIRWDAWYGARDPVGAYVEQALTPPEWHYRLPFFARINGASVSTNGSSIDTMKAEIKFAIDYNISFWAFVAYPPSTSMFYGQRNYLQVMNSTWSNLSTRFDIKFCLILDGNGLTMLSKGTTYFVKYFQLPFYQTVNINGENRPLLFIFGTNGSATGPDSPTVLIANLAAACKNKGIPKPYVVAMWWGGVAAKYQVMKALGADAISSYADVDYNYTSSRYQGKGLSYALNAQDEYKNIVDASTASVPIDIVPTITAGWDPRPREVTPPPWQHSKSAPGCNVSGVARCWVQDPTMVELRNHTRDVVRFAYSNSAPDKVARAGVVLISAWNEHDEGHWVCPSLLGNSTAKLEAVRNGLYDGKTQWMKLNHSDL